jgi:hypothetical protein
MMHSATAEDDVFSLLLVQDALTITQNVPSQQLVLAPCTQYWYNVSSPGIGDLLNVFLT